MHGTSGCLYTNLVGNINIISSSFDKSYSPNSAVGSFKESN